MTLYVKGSWKGWDGDTILQLTDCSVWRQDEYLYEYGYAYWPKVELKDSKLQVEGMSRAVRARRV